MSRIREVNVLGREAVKLATDRRGTTELTDERDECCRRGPAAIGSGGGGTPLPKGVAIIECALGAAAWPDLGCSDGIAAAQDTVEADRILSAA